MPDLSYKPYNVEHNDMGGSVRKITVLCVYNVTATYIIPKIDVKLLIK